MKITNKDVYNKEEFERWIHRRDLIPAERYLLEKYLNNKDSSILEAGCGAGRIIFELYKMGYRNLHGFDIAENLLNEAIMRKKREGKTVSFSLQNASNLNYPNEFFDYAIYLQQIMSLVEDYEERNKAVVEAYRILKPKGLCFFSFLSFDDRSYNYLLASFIFLIRNLRFEKEVNSKFRLLPWLKRGGNFNLKLWKQSEPLVYWFKTEEALLLLTKGGFKIVQFFTSKMLMEKNLKTYKRGGAFYVVVQK